MGRNAPKPIQVSEATRAPLKPDHNGEQESMPIKTASTETRPQPAMTVPALLQDQLGTLVRSLSLKLACASSWREFINEVRGKSYLSANIGNIPHTAHTYLQQLRDQGIQVRLDDPPWDTDKIIHSAQRGAHPSATVHRHFLNA